MDELLAVIGSNVTSMEQQFLKIISLLEAAETLSHSLVRGDSLNGETVIKLAETKQDFIDAFAAANRRETLQSIRETYTS